MRNLSDVFKEAAEKEKKGKDKILSIASAFFKYIQLFGDFYRLNLV